MKNILRIVFSSAFILLPFVAALAQQPAQTPCTGNLCLQNPLGSINTPAELIGRVLNASFGIVGSLALVMFVYGGITWMTSSGNPEKVKKGRDVLIWAAIGLFIVFSAYALVRVVLSVIAA